MLCLQLQMEGYVTGSRSLGSVFRFRPSRYELTGVTERWGVRGVALGSPSCPRHAGLPALRAGRQVVSRQSGRNDRNRVRSATTACGRTATVEFERERFERRRSQFDPHQPNDVLQSSRSTIHLPATEANSARAANTRERSVTESASADMHRLSSANASARVPTLSLEAGATDKKPRRGGANSSLRFPTLIGNLRGKIYFESDGPSPRVDFSAAQNRMAGRRVPAKSPHYQDAAVVEQRCRMPHARDIEGTGVSPCCGSRVVQFGAFQRSVGKRSQLGVTRPHIAARDQYLSAWNQRRGVGCTGFVEITRRSPNSILAIELRTAQ